MTRIIRTATYSRVSTLHHDQKPELQVFELKQYCTARGLPIIAEIVDHSFSGGTDQRPGLKTLLSLARSRKIDMVVVLKLDRLFRSLKHMVLILQEFNELGVAFVSIRESLDLSTSSGRLMANLLGAFAEFERELIRERTLLGLAHAKAKGKRLGRPQIHNLEAIRQLRSQGLSYRQIARRLNTPMGTIPRLSKAHT